MNKSKIIGFAVGPIGAAVLSFASLPILAWYFSAEDIGRVSMLQVVISFSVLIFSLGLDQAYVREYHEVADKAVLLKTAVLPGLIILLLVLLSVFLYSPPFLSRLLFEVESSVYSAVILCCLVSSFFSRFLSLILRMQERGLAFSMSQVLPRLLFLLMIGSCVLSGVSLGFDKLIAAQALSIIVVFLIFAWNTRDEWSFSLKKRIDIQYVKSLLCFGLPLIFGGMASWVLFAMDRVFLRRLSSFEELGIYSIASSVAAVAGIVSGVYTTIWAPIVFKWVASGEGLEKVDRVSEHVLASVCFMLCLSGMMAPIIPYFLPKEYASVQYLVVACMIVPLFYMVSEATSIGIGISRKSSYTLLASCMAAAINILGNYLLVPIYGAAGAAVSTALALWVFMVCRTEMSCLVWRKIPRVKLYATTFVCLSCAILSSLLGEKGGYKLVMGWFFLFISGFVVFNGSVAAVKRLVIVEYLSWRR